MSVKLRITLITALLLLLVSVVVSIYTLRAQQAQLHRESIKRVELALSMLSAMAGPPLAQGDILALADVADRAAKGQPERVCVADRGGIVLADSKHQLYGRSFDVLMTVAKSGRPYVARTEDLWQGATPVRDYLGRFTGIVYVSFSTRPMDEASAQVARQVALFALLLTCLGALAAYLLGSYFSAALSPLLAAIRGTAAGNYETTVPATGMSELDEIGQAFDRMTRLVGSEVRNLGTLNQLATNLMAARTLDQFAELIREACQALVAGDASLLAGDPRMGIIELVGAEPARRPVRHDHAAFRAVNEKRPITIGEDSELPPGSLLAEELEVSSGIVAPLITPEHTAVGVIAVEFPSAERPSPNRQDEATVMAVVNLAAPILATLMSTWAQGNAIAALGEILLPEEVPHPDELDIYAAFVPAEVSSGLGGDYYDVLPLGQSLWGVAIGDVSGKGLDAARYTAMTKYVVRSFALEHTSPAETVSHADEALSAQMEEMRFVTLFYCVVDVRQQTVTYCCAGHLPGLLHSIESDQVTELAVGGGVIGCVDCGTTPQFSEDRIPLRPGDTLLLYTDGIVEARRDHEEYGLERLGAVIRANARRSLKNIAKAITDDVRVFAGNVVRDDMTMVLLRLTEESGEEGA